MRVSESSRRGYLFDRADVSYGEDVEKSKANVTYLRYAKQSLAMQRCSVVWGTKEVKRKKALSGEIHVPSHSDGMK